MRRKRFAQEQIIGKLLEAELAFAHWQTAIQVFCTLDIAEQT